MSDNSATPEPSIQAPDKPANRKQRRAIKSQERKQVGVNAANAAKVVEVAEKSLREIRSSVTTLATNQKTLIEGHEHLRVAFNKNHSVYAQAIGAVDGHIAVLRAVMNAMYRGDVEVDDDGNIDWNMYYSWYNQHMDQQEQEQKPEMKQKEADVELFGGDYKAGDE